MKTIAIDLDGTLIDISERDYRIYADIILQLGCVPLPKGEYWKLRRDITDIHNILKKSGLQDGDVDFFLSKRRFFMEQEYYLRMDEMINGVPNVLNKLSNLFEIIILTKRHDSIMTMKQLKWLELVNYKLVVVSKNKIDAMMNIKELTAMVGDTENDILPANEIGIKSIAVLTGIRNEMRLKEFHPFCIVDSILDVPSIFI